MPESFNVIYSFIQHPPDSRGRHTLKRPGVLGPVYVSDATDKSRGSLKVTSELAERNLLSPEAVFFFCNSELVFPYKRILMAAVAVRVNCRLEEAADCCRTC